MALKRKIKKRRGRREGEKERLARERERERGVNEDTKPRAGENKNLSSALYHSANHFCSPAEFTCEKGSGHVQFMIFFPRLSLFLSLSSLSFLLFHSPCSEGWEIYNVGDYVAFSFFAKNPVIPPFLDFLSPDFLLFSFFFFPFSFSFLASILDRARKTSLQGVNARKKTCSKPITLVHPCFAEFIGGINLKKRDDLVASSVG